MVRKSSSHLYTGLSMPKELMDKVDQIIRENPDLGIKSRAEFVKDAIRHMIKNIGNDVSK